LKGPTLYKAPPLPAWTWAGLYLGVNAGYDWGKSNTGTVFSNTTTGTPLLATITSAALKGVIFVSGALAPFGRRLDLPSGVCAISGTA